MKVRTFVTASLLIPASLLAQSGRVETGLATITEARVKAGIERIAHDSMGGRDTPSPGLDQTARWIASEFERFRLEPAGEKGGFLQQYEVHVATPDPDSSFFLFTDPNGATFRFAIGPEIRSQGSLPRTAATMEIVVIGGGQLDTTALDPARIHGKLAIVAHDWSQGMSDAVQQMVFALVNRGAQGVLLPIEVDSIVAQFGFGLPEAPQVELGPPRPAAQGNGRFFALVPEKVMAGRIPEAGALFGQLRSSPTTTMEVPEGWRVTVIGKMAPATSALVPNVAGIVRGTDPTLRNEYVVISAHMDHVGTSCGGSVPEDRICNGADDDASGTVGVVELAQAFSRAPTKRSILFLVVSGEEKGLWGSAHFAAKPTVPLGSIVANLNMDMIGRNWPDTIVAIGKEHSDLGATAERVAAAHPELGLTVVDDLWPAENLYFRSDHYNFARRGVPVLFFTSGLHPDYHAVTDTPDRIDAEKETRILKLVYLLGHRIGETQARPKWNPESYRRIVK